MYKNLQFQLTYEIFLVFSVYPLQPPSTPPFFQTIYIDLVTILIICSDISTHIHLTPGRPGGQSPGLR